MKYFFLMCSITILSFSCSSGSSKLEDETEETIVVNIESSVEIDKVSMHDLMEDISYVQLNGSDDFYVTDVERVLVWNDKILLLEKNKKVVVAFKTNGDFEAIVGSKGAGPGQYYSATDFSIDYKRKLILVFSRGDQAVFEYDEQFRFVRKVSLGFFAFYMSILDSGHLAFYLDMNSERDGGSNIWVCDSNGNVIEKRMPFPTDKQYVSMAYTGFLKNGYYTFPLSSHIYQLNEDKGSDKLAFRTEFPGMREEGLRFDHTSYRQKDFSQRKDILQDFIVGKNGQEVIFSHGYRLGVRKFIGFSVRNSSDQVFSYLNLKQGKDTDSFGRLFFNGGYLPTYSNESQYYYMLTSMGGFDLFHHKYKDQMLSEIEELDSDLYKLLIQSKDTDNPIFIRFKLKSKL